ncbi:MAG: NAD-dependent epimerase [Ignavibacteriaceae bacterium]|nr:NAD-dependent epimerase [Ignavibacteriaceae bacterium]
MKVLITGAAGFIGFHLINKLVNSDYRIVGIDNLNDYYDVGLKISRLEKCGIPGDKINCKSALQSQCFNNYKFVKLDLTDRKNLAELFEEEKFDYVVNLAAQAGVRYSIDNPYVYIESNVVGFLNILENARNNSIKHLVYASSSSVYGLNEKFPFSTKDNVDHPISLYSASKKANELMAHTYSHLYKIPTTGLRFFSVYGPWGRPDMAFFKFTKSILNDQPIEVYNHGNMKRDFTYIDDIVTGIEKVLKHIPKGNNEWNGKTPDPGSSKAQYKLYNIGNNSSVSLLSFIEAIEKKLNKKAEKILLPMQPGDVPNTMADIDDLIEDLNYKPKTSIDFGIGKFIDWYLDYYKIS